LVFKIIKPPSGVFSMAFFNNPFKVFDIIFYQYRWSFQDMFYLKFLGFLNHNIPVDF